METQTTKSASNLPHWKSVKMDVATHKKLESIADKFFEGNHSMAFREAIRRYYRAEFEPGDKTR